MSATTRATPLYQVITRDVEEKIRRGQLRPGDPILSTARMCDYYHVSAITAKAAIVLLREKGLVRSLKGKGSFVARAAASPRHAAPRAAIRRVTVFVRAVVGGRRGRNSGNQTFGQRLVDKRQQGVARRRHQRGLES